MGFDNDHQPIYLPHRLTMGSARPARGGGPREHGRSSGRPQGGQRSACGRGERAQRVESQRAGVGPREH
jgi:hypothetical protein